jgi:hypothetical protein
MFMGMAQKGGDFGRKLARPHENKPGFVLVGSTVILMAGFWVKNLPQSVQEGTDFFYWLGTILIGAGCLGLFRFSLLLFGKDFSKH